MLPATLGLPGGIELAVILLMLLVFAGIAVAVVTVGRSVFGGSDDRIEELEARVADLEAELAEERRDDQ